VPEPVESVEGERAARLGYQPSLDGLRAAAIALVIAAHYGGARVTAGLLKGGFHGVDLFFVLSGFLITVLLLEEWRGHGSISLSRFYARRALRLFPALWAFLAVYLLVTLVWIGSVEQGLLTALYGLTYTMNVLETFSGTAKAAADHLGVSHLWSLGLEEQFYVLWPAALYLLLRRGVRTRSILSVLVVVIVALVVVRESVRSGSMLRFDAILIGCALGVAFKSSARPVLLRIAHSPLVFSVALVAAGWLAMRSSGQNIGPLHESNSFVFCLLAAVLVCGAVSLPESTPAAPVRWILTLPPVVFVGRISYALYLWHQPVLVWFQRTRLETSLGSHPTALIALSVSVILSTLSYYLVERRFLRRKWQLSRTSSHDVGLGEAVHAGGTAALG